MEHEEIERTRTTERYLLGELEPEARDRFEEHVFDCPECALDLRAAAMFVEGSKVVLAQPELQARPTPTPAKPGWMSWLRPAFAVPLMAAMMAVIAYLAVANQQRSGLDAPQILASVSLAGANTRGGTRPAVSPASGSAFVVFVDIPADSAATVYQAELHNPQDSVEWKMPISTEAAKDTIALRIPAPHGGSGSYVLIVRAVRTDGQSVEAARYPFDIKVQ